MERPVTTDLDPAPRLLLGPGPSGVPARVLRALSAPPVGHLDPQFIEIMDETQQLLRFIFQTRNELTLPISGTGTAGMEAALSNFIEPGDRVLVAVMGFFGERMVAMAGRYGAQVDRLDRPWGQVFDAQEIAAALKSKAYKLVALVHAETSTGALQPGIADIAAAAHSQGALLVLDTVTSLGGLPVEIDAWDVDVAYSASQKCLSAPSGLAPLTVSPRAQEVFARRRAPVANWYLDLAGLSKYWGKERAYHHTAPINMIYSLREALRIAAEEGLEERFARHRASAEQLWAGLEDMDLDMFVPLEHRIPSLTTPRIPPGVDDASVRRQLLEDYNIEIAGGFGPLKGQVWRIGLMGFNSRRENVALLLAALRQILSGGH